MFGIGTTEVIVILVVALLVIGPSKLPDAARALGKGLAEFRRMSSDVKKTLDMESKLSEFEESKGSSGDGQTGSTGEQPSSVDHHSPETAPGEVKAEEKSASESETRAGQNELRPRLQPVSEDRNGDRS